MNDESAWEEDYWPEVIDERELDTEVDCSIEGINVKSKFEGNLEMDIQPGHRVRCVFSELELEADDLGFCVIFVNGVPVKRLRVREVAHLHALRSAETGELWIVAINGAVVWTHA